MVHNVEKNNQGTILLEVLICIGIAVVLIFSIGKALAATHRLDTASSEKEMALAYARQSMEIMAEIKNNEFACVCNTINPPIHCTEKKTGNTCLCNSLLPGYTSCFVSSPGESTTTGPFQLALQSNQWVLVSGIETIAENPAFTRQIHIENISGDPNRKKVSVTVHWTEQNQSKETSLSTILTAWENISP